MVIFLLRGPVFSREQSFSLGLSRVRRQYNRVRSTWSRDDFIPPSLSGPGGAKRSIPDP